MNEEEGNDREGKPVNEGDAKQQQGGEQQCVNESPPRNGYRRGSEG